MGELGVVRRWRCPEMTALAALCAPMQTFGSEGRCAACQGLPFLSHRNRVRRNTKQRQCRAARARGRGLSAQGLVC